MNPIYTREGMKRLRSSWILLAASLVAAALLITGTHVYLEKEKRDAVGSNHQLREARARLDNIRKERESLEESATIFRALLARGLMQPERRLDLVELVNTLRARHHIDSIDYEIAPQRPLALAGNRAFPAVDIVASRVKLKLRALHEGDVLEFIEALGESRQGFHPVDKCVLKRVEGMTPGLLLPRVEAECTLEWITMKEKRA
jgi:hypothetical protein